jgi:hypothetical protein
MPPTYQAALLPGNVIPCGPAAGRARHCAKSITREPKPGLDLPAVVFYDGSRFSWNSFMPTATQSNIAMMLEFHPGRSTPQ